METSCSQYSGEELSGTWLRSTHGVAVIPLHSALLYLLNVGSHLCCLSASEKTLGLSETSCKVVLKWYQPAYLAAPTLLRRRRLFSHSLLLEMLLIALCNFDLDAMAPKFVKSKHEIFGLTHFLCIPIATPHSMPQLEQTLHRFKIDPSTSKIPSGSYRPLQTLHIPIEVFSLPTAGRIAAACHHLRSLDIDGLLRKQPEGASRSKRGVREVQQKVPPVNQGSHPYASAVDSISPPFTVTLRGVRCRSSEEPASQLFSRFLKTPYIDSTSRLGPLLDHIRRYFHVAGFQVPGLIPEYYGYITFLDTQHASSRPKTVVPHYKQANRIGRALSPLLETKDIIQKFENFVFAEDIRLERLSLCELGLQKAIEKFGAEAQLSEVCSVPLP